jgi:hypothetical protein
MKRSGLLLPLVIGMTLVCMTTFSEAASKIIHVTATLDQKTSFPVQLGDSNTANADLADDDGNSAGTLVSHCTIVSVPNRALLEQCLLTADFPSGQILFGGLVPLPTPEASAEFGILGGTGQFDQVQGTVHGFVNPSGTIDFTFMLK